MQLGENAMLSISSMIRRFRDNKPTSRQERERIRKQRKNKEQLWWVRDEHPSEDNDPNPNSSGKDQMLLPDGRLRKIRWAGVDIRCPAGEDARCIDGHSTVDKLISKDIERFIANKADGTDRASKLPRVSPSQSLAPTSYKPPRMVSHPPKRSALPFDRERAARSDPRATHGEDTWLELNIRDSLALDPKVYTGSAELRGGTSPTSSHPATPDGLSKGERKLDLTNDKNARIAVSSAAEVASDLDGVLKQLRNGMPPEQLMDASGRGEQASMPVNLTQIAHDLDAKLLEFTLMAKAREQIADEAREAEKVEKDAWRQGETKRVEDMVRQEYDLLQDAGNEREPVSASRGLPKQFDLVLSQSGNSKSRELDCDRDKEIPRHLSILHPRLPPVSFEGHPHRILEHGDIPVDAFAHQMAGVLRAVEVKVKQIEALQAGRSEAEDRDGVKNSSNAFITAANSPLEASSPQPSVAEDKGDDCRRDVSALESVKPLVVARDSVTLAAGSNGACTKDNRVEKDNLPSYASHNAQYDLSGHFLIPSDAQVFPNMVPQSWRNGPTSLQEAGQCIGAELEVFMLCMEKRLGKQPVDQDAEGVSNHGVGNPTKETRDNVVDARQVGDSLDALPQETLEALADEAAIRREQKTHEDVDRELGIVYGDAPLSRWRDTGSKANHLMDGGRVQQVEVEATREMEMGGKKYYHGVPRSSSTHPLEHGMLAIPVDEPLSHNNGLPLEKDMGASLSNILPVSPPSGGAVSTLVPPAPMPQQVLRPVEDRFRPPARSYYLPDQSPREHVPDAFGEKSRHLLMEGLLQQEGSDGFAVARARQRLHSFRTARENMSRDYNIVHSHENFLPRQISVDRQVALSLDESKRLLGRLKEMRHYATKGA